MIILHLYSSCLISLKVINIIQFCPPGDMFLLFLCKFNIDSSHTLVSHLFITKKVHLIHYDLNCFIFSGEGTNSCKAQKIR